MAVIQARPTHILYQCAKFGDDRIYMAGINAAYQEVLSTCEPLGVIV